MLSSSAMAWSRVISGCCGSAPARPSWPRPRPGAARPPRSAAPGAGRRAAAPGGRSGCPCLLAAARGRPGGHRRAAAGQVRRGQRAGPALLAAERPGLLLGLAEPPADHDEPEHPGDDVADHRLLGRRPPGQQRGGQRPGHGPGHRPARHVAAGERLDVPGGHRRAGQQQQRHDPGAEPVGHRGHDEHRGHPQAATNTEAITDVLPRQTATGPYPMAMRRSRSSTRGPRLKPSTTMINRAMTSRIFTGSGAAPMAWRARASRSCAIRLPGRDPSSGRISLPRAVPCIAHYHALTATHNQIPAENGQARFCPACLSGSGWWPVVVGAADHARVMASCAECRYRGRSATIKAADLAFLWPDELTP